MTIEPDAAPAIAHSIEVLSLLTRPQYDTITGLAGCTPTHRWLASRAVYSWVRLDGEHAAQVSQWLRREGIRHIFHTDSHWTPRKHPAPVELTLSSDDATTAWTCILFAYDTALHNKDIDNKNRAWFDRLTALRHKFRVLMPHECEGCGTALTNVAIDADGETRGDCPTCRERRIAWITPPADHTT